MELVSLRCNRDFTSASSYGLGWYKYAIATQWYQFHTTDAWWFSLMIHFSDNMTGLKRHNHEQANTCELIRSPAYQVAQRWPIWICSWRVRLTIVETQPKNSTYIQYMPRSMQRLALYFVLLWFFTSQFYLYTSASLYLRCCKKNAINKSHRLAKNNAQTMKSCHAPDLRFILFRCGLILVLER